jgi:ubiquinone/menaquinone biosynthesis C-methylase UbiE
MSANIQERLAEFWRIEHAGWERLAGGYDIYFRDVAAQMIDPILNAAGVTAGTCVLDLCCGPGYVAARARERGASPVGIDYSSEMVALAKTGYPDIAFREGDAESLHLEDRTFDAVVMNLGLHHIARPERAIAEAARVLRPGGRLAFTVWASPTDSIAHRIIFEAVKVHGCLDVVPEGPPMFRFSDAQECQHVCAAAGLSDVTVRTLQLVWDVPAAHGLIEAGQAGGVRLAMLLDAQTGEALQRIKEAVQTACAGYQRDGRQRVPVAVALTSATLVGR